MVLPYSRAGIVGGVILGLSRAIGEAIAVTQVIGAGIGIHASLFHTARHPRRSNRIAVPGRGDELCRGARWSTSALILLVLALVVNVIARIIVQRGTLKDASTPLTESAAL